MDFDEDDLINDYVEDFDEPPMDEYDEAMIEAMMGGEVPSDNIRKKNNAVSNKENSENNALSPGLSQDDGGHEDGSKRLFATQEEDDVEDEEEDAAMEDPSPAVQNYIAAQSPQNSLYQFDRFQQTSEWRSKPADLNNENTLKADVWKSKMTALTALHAKKKRQSNAPEAALLRPKSKYTSKDTCTKLSLVKRNVLTTPKEGVSAVPLTLSDGSRVYVPMKEVQSNGFSQKDLYEHNNNDNKPLGISMKDLMARSEQIRRRTEHTKRTMQEREEKNIQASTSKSFSVEDQLWVDKHAPSAFPHLLSDERTNREVLRALRAWDPYVFGRDPPPRPAFQTKNMEQDEKKPTNSADKRPDENNRVILLSGPPGVGKSTLAHIVARHAGYRPLEVNGSDERSASVLTDRVVRAMESATLDFNANSKDNGRPNCLILDEIDGADAKGAVQALVDIIRAEMPVKKGGKTAPYLRRPIIFICNHKYAPALRPLLPYARHFQVQPPSNTRLVARLQAVLAKEKLNMMGGSQLLHQLVTSTGGDIRSCLYTLQFAAAQNDLSKALQSSIGGGGKDGRSDAATTISSVFLRPKKLSEERASVTRVLEAVDGFGDPSRTLNSLFLNIHRVSYIDPTLDRCATANEWISGADVFSSDHLGDNPMHMYGMQRMHIPSVAGAIHLLCRIETKSDLTFTTREISNLRYQTEANLGVVQKFSENLPPSAKCRAVDRLSLELIPFALWVLSAGEGAGSLNRAASSLEILTKHERIALDAHVAVLGALGLTYVVDQESVKHSDHVVSQMRLEPPIDRLVSYQKMIPDKTRLRKEVPAAMKEILAHQARLSRLRSTGSGIKLPETNQVLVNPESPQKKETSKAPETPATGKIRKLETLVASASAPKRSKTSPQMAKANFLGIGAKKALEAKYARKAASVGLDRTKKTKMAHTGSGLPLNGVVRLKYVKGFTQAVRTPCPLQNLE